MRTIALEEYATPAFLDGPDRRLKQVGRSFAALIAQLVDVGDGRVAMGAAGVDVQALLLTSPGVEQLGAPKRRDRSLEARTWDSARQYGTIL
jgi:hypothetical protein